MLDYAFMEKALPFLLKAIPVTLGLTFLVLVLSFLPALFLADRRIRGRGWGEKLITLYISFEILLSSSIERDICRILKPRRTYKTKDQWL